MSNKRKAEGELPRRGRKPKDDEGPSSSKRVKLAPVSVSQETKQKEKGGKGLRHFSMVVCQKVEEKGVTTYSEVADELIAEMEKDEDDKNIRRRVYDALNVLMAMNVISKDKKEIKWIGLPKNSLHGLIMLENEKRELAERVEKKKIHLQELILQEISLKNLMSRNEKMENNSSLDPKSCLQLPFILINTKPETKINCEMLEDRSQYYFEFDMPFEIHDDIEVLRRMGLNRCSTTQIKELIPAELHKFLPPNLQAADPSGSEAMVSYEPQSMPSSSSPATSPFSNPPEVEDFEAGNLLSASSSSNPPSPPIS